MHWSALVEKNNIKNNLEKNSKKNSENNSEKNNQIIKKDFKKSNKPSVFKQNSHTIDMNLVAQKALLKDEVEEMHWSAETFLNETVENNVWFWVKSEDLNNENYQQNIQNLQKNNYINKQIQNKNISKNIQSWPKETMLFWLWFLSLLLAFFFRRRKRI